MTASDLTRRHLLLAAASAAAPLTLPPLPYPENALDPVISAATVSFHHGKHHRAHFRQPPAGDSDVADSSAHSTGLLRSSRPCSE